MSPAAGPATRAVKATVPRVAASRAAASKKPARREAEGLAARLPPLLIAALRVAATVEQGVHGRRRIGTGDAFWQFRQYQPGEPATRIDWRQSAKSDRLFLRETEWAAAQSVWFWRDASASMDWHSAPGLPRKRERAELLTLALASLLLRAGERPPIDAARTNTTLVCLCTDARLTKTQAWIVARAAAAGLARAVSPCATAFDGDMTFVLASGAVEADPLLLGVLGAEVTSAAIRDAVLSADAAPGCPTAADRAA